MVPIFKNVGDRSTSKNYHSVSLPSVVSKVFAGILHKLRSWDFRSDIWPYFFFSQ